MTAKRIPGNWFEVNNGCYCGVVMPEHVAKKLVKLFAKHNDEVKDLLTQNKEELYAYDWTLAYPNGKQKSVYYNSTHSSVEDRIERYDESMKMRRLEDFYISDASGAIERKGEVIQLYMEKYDIGDIESEVQNE